MAGGTGGGTAARGGAIDALRFLAAGFIVLFHFGWKAPVPLDRVHEMFGRGYLATDFFLLLSGFVMARAYGGAVADGSLRLGAFMGRRLARIYPAHLITLAALVAMVLAAAAVGVRPDFPEHFAWSAVIPNLLLVHAWGYGGDTWNIPTWSLSALMGCYLIFPALWRAVARLRRPGVCLAVFVGVIVASDVASLAILGREEFDLPFRFGLLRALPLFVAGMMLARLCQTAALSRRASILVAAAGLAAFAIEAMTNAPDVLRVFATAAVLVGCGQAVGRPSRTLEWAGKVSFSLFITHTISGLVWFKVVGAALAPFAQGPAAQWLLWGGALPFAVAAAAAFHHLVDQPIQLSLRPLTKGRSQAPLAVQPA